MIERDAKGRVQHISSFNLKSGPDSFSLSRGFGSTMQQRMTQIIPASYKPGLAAALLSPAESVCFLGTDGFMDTNLTYEMGFGCYDPFRGFGSDPHSGGGGGAETFDPFLGFDARGSETCEQCKARQQRICYLTFVRACSATSLSTATWVGVGCVVVSGGLGLAICVAIIFSGIGWAGAACRALYDACLLSVVDKCPQC